MIFSPPIHGLAHIPILQFDYPNLAPHFRALPMSRCGGRSPPTPIHNPACPGRRECDRETDYVLLLPRSSRDNWQIQILSLSLSFLGKFAFAEQTHTSDGSTFFSTSLPLPRFEDAQSAVIICWWGCFWNYEMDALGNNTLTLHLHGKYTSTWQSNNPYSITIVVMSNPLFCFFAIFFHRVYITIWVEIVFILL